LKLIFIGDEMHETKIIVSNKIKLKNPTMIVGLPGIGNVGRIAVRYMIEQLKAKKFAELYSPYFVPVIIVDEKSVARTIKNEFYYYKSKEKDFIFLTGDSQSMTPYGHYEINGMIINFAKSMGVNEIITIGGFNSESIDEKPKVIGVVNNEKLIKKYQNCGMEFSGNKIISTIVGSTGLLIGMANSFKIAGLSIIVGTPGFPTIIADPKAAEAALSVLMKVTNLKVNMKEIDQSVKIMKDSINKTEELQKKIIEDMKEDKNTNQYIG